MQNIEHIAEAPPTVKVIRIDEASQTVVRGDAVRTYVTRLRQEKKSLQTQLLKTKKLLADVRIDRDSCKQKLDEISKSCRCQFLTPQQLEFVESQAKANTVPKTSMRWTPRVKSGAVRLYLKSPSAYKSEKEKWKLPSKSTLMRLIRPIYNEVSTR